ncbi:hypothetical protein B4U30_04705 [Klebsiella pneumoniae]|uniref:Putative inner membrane protein n=2 Tax=Klebsiella pneumoniae TaxID=573 RepID=A0A218N4Z8_KLEPN|nr:putative inner membrane protein [Klebsiella pneumoniae subsp. pneumoniae Kp13]ASF81277.1 putative inner membrane protein [Klebsiella pneumoniae]ECC3818645.1 hypothetical protein [Salmonella enterica subsp. enterica]OKO56318.1 hypothetical protein BSF34_27905 [Escherichia coli]WFK31339.1 hypothetical protein LNOBJIOA_00019 [Enterobacter kobei]HBX4001103.1 hypothetical protein [Klebsiella variicola]
MDNCYISIGLIDYNPGLAWTATLIVFCTGIVIGFITEIDKKSIAIASISAFALAFICLLTLMLFGMKIGLC